MPFFPGGEFTKKKPKKNLREFQWWTSTLPIFSNFRCSFPTLLHTNILYSGVVFAHKPFPNFRLRERFHALVVTFPLSRENTSPTLETHPRFIGIRYYEIGRLSVPRIEQRPIVSPGRMVIQKSRKNFALEGFDVQSCGIFEGSP